MVRSKRVLASTVSMGLLLSGALLMGCAPGSQDAASTEATGDPAATAGSEQLSVDSHLFQLMDQLAEADTVEQATAIIGFEGEKGEESQSEEGDSRTWSKAEYLWDLGDGTKIEGEFTAYPAEPANNDMIYVGDTKVYAPHRATYTAYFKGSNLRDHADFSQADTMKAKLNSDEGLTYDQLVELVGGVPGVKETVSTLSSSDGVYYPSFRYEWSNIEGGSLTAYVGNDGTVGMITGYF